MRGITLARIAALFLAPVQLCPGLYLAAAPGHSADRRTVNAVVRPAAGPQSPAFAAGSSSAAPANVASLTALDAGFTELYNLKFDRAHAEFDRWVRQNPDDPLGPACRLAVYLFQQLEQMRIPHSSLLADNRVKATASGTPDARLKAMFDEQLRKARNQAHGVLVRRPNDERALLALTLTYAVHADYVNVVEKRSWASLTLFKKSNDYAQQLLKRNPAAYEAWAATGQTEYLASTLPFYARLFVRFDSVKGDKKTAVEELQRAATNARYLRPYAKMLLAGLYMRERQPQESLRLLKELNLEFPDNTLIAAELKALSAPRR